MRDNTRKALQLCLLALVNYLIFYGIGVWLARALGVSGFKAYSVAVAAVTLLASVTTLGLEKYAQRVLPAYWEAGDWAHARGFVIFGRNVVVSVALIAVAICGLVFAGKWIVAQVAPSSTTLLALLFLPVMVVTLFMLEALASTGEVVRGTLVYRLLLPSCVTLMLALIWLSPASLTVTLAVLSYGGAWVVSLLMLRRLAWRVMGDELLLAQPAREPRKWLLGSVPFLIHSVMMTQFASLGIAGLELLGSREQEVALLAAAMQTGGFIILLATATNRLYGPLVSRLIERRDYSGILATIKERHAWIVPATLVYLTVMVIFGRRILRLFGAEFEAGYPALCLIAAGASISVWFAMAPNYLKFVGRNGQVLGITAAAGLLNVALLVALGPRWGATGAAAAYAISLAVMAVVFFLLGIRSARTVTRQGA
jgi:O-antigen/teichoic acid export membrane protein